MGDSALSPAETKRRAVFLDRDGVLNAAIVRDGKPYPPSSLSQFVLLEDAASACQSLKAAGFALVVVTNQPDVGRGTQFREVVEAMHREMLSQLPIDHLEVCWHSGQGAPCACRKPAPGMLLEAAAALGLDLPASYMIGDRWRDVDCGWAAGCTTIFLDRGYREELRTAPHFIAAGLREAAAWILARDTPCAAR